MKRFSRKLGLAGTLFGILALVLVLVPPKASGLTAAGGIESDGLQTQASSTVTITYPYADSNNDGANDYVLEYGRLSNNFKFSYSTAQSTTEPQDGMVSATYSYSTSYNYFYRVTNPLDDDVVTYGNYIDGDYDITVTPNDLQVGEPADGVTFDKQTVVRDFSLNSYDIGDLYLNVGPTGHLQLAKGDSFSLYPLRNWLPVEGTGNTQMLQPDYQVRVIDLEGSGVLSATEETRNTADKHMWALKATNPGTALVMVTYDALVHAGAMGSPRFSAIWPENTGLFVVTVGKSCDVEMGALSNADMDSQSKLAGAAWDAELDVLYYFDNEGASYTLHPEEGAQVEVARGSIESGSLQIGAFSTEGVQVNADGSVTVSGLVQGKHVLRVSHGEKVAYQIVRAKHADWTLYGGEVLDEAHLIATSASTGANAYTDGATAITRTAYDALDDSDKESYEPLACAGAKVTLVFDRLYHPASKLSGIYNMNAIIALRGPDGIAYEQELAAEYGGPAQYTFSSNAKCQRIAFNIPDDAEESLVLSVALKAHGFGSSYGAHRQVTYKDGVSQNNNAPTQTAYFGGSEPIAIDLVEPQSADNPDDPDAQARQAAAEFSALVRAIGTVTLGSADQIAAAREAYDALDFAALAYVDPEDEDLLFAAEEQLAALQETTFLPVDIQDGCVRVMVENSTYPVSAGAPWEDVLVDCQVAIEQEDTMRTLVDKALEQAGLEKTKGTEGYIRSIGGISEKAYDPEGDDVNNSGWMCRLNGWFINAGLNAFTASNTNPDFLVREGDEIHILYTVDGGPDVGSYPNRETKALDRIAVSGAALTPSFASDVHDYELAVDSESPEVYLKPVAKNQNWQVRMFLDGDESMSYRSNDAIPVRNGSTIKVVVGDPSWPSMNANSDEAEEYRFIVRIPGAANTDAALKTASAANVTYNGKAQKPSVTVKDVAGKVVPSTAYTLTWSKNTNAGTASVVATAKSNSGYSGKATANFKINPAKITSVADIANQLYKGQANLPQPKPMVKAGSLVLAAKDYTVTYEYYQGHDKKKYVGPAKATVNAKGNYTGKITKAFKVVTVADSKSVGAKLDDKTLAGIDRYKTTEKRNPGYVEQVSSKTMTTVAKPRAKTMEVTWGAVKGATNYIVGYKRATDPAWSYEMSGGKTKRVFRNMKEGDLMEFRVSVYNGKTFARGEWTQINCRFYREMVKLKAAMGKGKVDLSWGKVIGATGYQVLVATKMDMSDAKIIAVKGGSTLKARVTKMGTSKLITNRKYYIKVRAVKMATNALGKKNTYVGINSHMRAGVVK